LWSEYIRKEGIPLRKYWEISKIYMKAQLVWRADVVFNMVFTITKILFAYLLWNKIFVGKNTVMGFSFFGMMSYYIVSSFLSQLEMSHGISEEINQRIRYGTFSKYMVVPLNIEGYFVAMEIGVVLFYFLFDFLAGVVWIGIFRIQFIFTNSLFVIGCAIIMIIVGMIFMVQLNYYLGLLTLKYQGIGTFLMIKNNLVSLITGSIVPLVLFPDTIIQAMKLLPFYYITYLPSMLLVGYCADEALPGIAIISIWCIVLQVVIKYTWKKYVREYDGVGI
jgi:ABC-2 type transport system permease protein